MLFEDDLMEAHKPYAFQYRISNSDIQTSSRVPLVVCYNLADTGKTPYGFNQAFTKKDTEMYFKRMQDICNSTIYDLIDNVPIDWHFHTVKVEGDFRNLLKQVHPNAVNAIVTIYQFALYTSKEGASRKSGIRSPRVYFMLGDNGRIYPLFFDPYHELHPMVLR